MNPTWSAARVAEFEDGNSVRFRTRGHHGNAGDGGHSGHGGREIVRHNDGVKDRWVNVARLALFAWTPEVNVEDLWAVPPEERTDDPRTDKMEAHHHWNVPWLNAEWNLEWRGPDDHGEIESERRERGPDGAYAGARATPGPGPETESTDPTAAADGGRSADSEKASPDG